MTLHDEVELEDMDWSEELQAFTYQCPCGDLFQITLDELASGGPRSGAVQAATRGWASRASSLTRSPLAGEEVAKCPSCSLYVKVIYDPEDFKEALEPAALEPSA